MHGMQFSTLTEVTNQRIRNRWLVAYTLIHNPSLRPLRVAQQSVQEEQNEKEREAMDEGNVYIPVYEEVLTDIN